MKLKILALVIVCALVFPGALVLADDSKEVLTLKRDLTQQKMLTIKNYHQLLTERVERMKVDYRILEQELAEYDKRLKALEAEKPKKPVEENKKQK
jgi:hypothetical protein